MNKKKRILLKISGEAFIGKERFGHDNNALDQICEDIKEVYDLGYEICLVVGGGNICRGEALATMGIERSNADYMGMLATLINSIALQSKLESKGLFARVSSALPVTTVAEQYLRSKAIRQLGEGKIIIFASGTGNPFFTTDTAAVLRAVEMNCDFVLKGSKVDGVYNDDPLINNQAKKFHKLEYNEIIHSNLKVMDLSAIILARDNKVPIIIFNVTRKGNFSQVIQRKGDFTEII
jgi:uridylate kinase